MALKLKNVSVVREYLKNFMRKNDIGSINMIYDCIKYIIEKNRGDDRDEYIMNFVRTFMSTTTFYQIDNLEG